MLIEPTKKKEKQSPDFGIIPKKKMTWKDKLKRDIFRENQKIVQQYKKKKSVYQQQNQRIAAKQLSILMDTNKTIYLKDQQQQFPNHGNYSSYIPLPHQQKLNDQLKNTFPYVQYLAQKNHVQSKKIVYDEISNHIRACIDNNSVEIGWRSCLKKYICSIDAIKAVQIYIQFLKKGTQVLDFYHKKYGNGCSKQVFFHRICQSSKYFKQNIKLNKNIKTSIETTQEISEATLPKTCKYLYCKICMLYDCNHHNNDSLLDQYNYQYVAKSNIVPQHTHVTKILTLIKFHQKLLIDNNANKQCENKIGSLEKKNMVLEQMEQGQEQLSPKLCSTYCYLNLTNETYKKKVSSRRPIISLIQRATIKMGINIFSYDPHDLFIWIGGQTVNKVSQGVNQIKGMTCEDIFFYLFQQYNIVNKLERKLFNSQYQMLLNQGNIIKKPKQQQPIQNKTNKKKQKKNPLRAFNHQDNDNYSIGCCFHYIIDKPVIDQQCNKCYCRRRGFCLPSCQCPQSCPIKKIGCKCKGKQECQNNKCPCNQRMQQCLPGVCQNCYDSSHTHNKKNSCKNSLLILKKKKNIKIGASNIEGCGLGAFAGQDIQKGQFVIMYTGQMILHQIDYIRQSLRIDQSFYNFGLNQGGASDARFMGNKSRFINHGAGEQQNLLAQNYFSQGQFRTILVSKRNIKKGQQLFFNYDATGDLLKQFPGKYPFIQSKKKKKNTQKNN